MGSSALLRKRSTAPCDERIFTYYRQFHRSENTRLGPVLWVPSAVVEFPLSGQSTRFANRPAYTGQFAAVGQKRTLGLNEANALIGTMPSRREGEVCEPPAGHFNAVIHSAEGRYATLGRGRLWQEARGVFEGQCAPDRYAVGVFKEFAGVCGCVGGSLEGRKFCGVHSIFCVPVFGARVGFAGQSGIARISTPDDSKLTASEWRELHLLGRRYPLKNRVDRWPARLRREPRPPDNPIAPSGPSRSRCVDRRSSPRLQS